MCHNKCEYWKITGHDEGRCIAKRGHEPCDDEEETEDEEINN